MLAGAGSSCLRRRLEALQHRLPVGDHDAHLPQDVGDGGRQVARLGLRQGAQVDGDVAFLVAVAPVRVARHRRWLQASGLVALGLEDRVQQEAHGEAAGLQLAQHRIDQERHVVVEDLDDRARRQSSACRPPVRRTPILCRPFGFSAMNSNASRALPASQSGGRPSSPPLAVRA